MAAPAKTEEFLDLVRKSKVADEKRFEPHIQRLRQAGQLPPEATKAAGILVRDGILTQFQAEQLLQGKWRRFNVGKYKVLEKLGSGGMGQVYLCEHKLMRRRVAVKILPTAKAQDESALERFYREARAVAALDHPNIVHAYDIDQDEALHFLVMEYVDGSNLQDIIKKTGPMNVLRACHYIRQAAQGLEHANRSGLVHRDIKPGNILVDRSGVVKVLDMGLARFFNDEEDILTKKYDENVLGTADYLAPEQALDSHSVDIRADIYGLGATFYFMLTGKTPFGEGTVAQKLIWHQTRQPKAISELRPDVPPGIVAVINKMMAKDPAQRYQVPAGVAEALAPFTQTQIAPPPDEEMPHLSPAATGVASETQPDTVVRGTTPLRPATPRPTAAAPPGRTPSPSRSGPPVAQPIPAAVASPSGVSTSDDAHWAALEDTQDPRASDTTPQSQRRRNLTEEVFQSTKRRMWLIVLVTAIPIVVAVVILVVVFVANQTPVEKKPPEGGTKDRPKREKLIVRKAAHGADEFTTVWAALQDARPGEVIEVQDDLEENVFLDGSRLASNLTIRAAPGKRVVWKAAKNNPEDSLLHLSGAEGFTLNGRGIIFDGTLKSGAVQDLVTVQLRCPGLVLQDARFETFGRSGVYFVNAQGTAERPIKLSNVEVRGPAKEKGAAVYLDAEKDILAAPWNDHIRIEADCRFDGFPAGKAVEPARSEVVGKDVQILAK